MENPQVRYRLDPDDRFVIENYNQAKAFSNFFPGIAGRWGVPLWAYYVSKAQAVCSVGFRDKDGQILEFDSFNKAAMTVARQGFRTFIMVGGAFHEAFKRTRDPAVHQEMAISAGELELTERNEAAGYTVEVTYHALSNQPVGGFVRQVRLTNTARERRRFQWVDGVARILPAGMTWQHVKTIPRHIEAMMGSLRVGGFPLFRLKQSAADVERVEDVHGGNFYVSIHDGRPVPERVVVDPDLLFGESVNYDHPWVLEDLGAERVLALRQIRGCKTPCAFTVLNMELDPGEETRLVSVIGHVEEDHLLEELLQRLQEPGFLDDNRSDGRRVLAEIMDRSLTVSAEPAFDAYCRQNFLDNAMRGGLPLMLDTAAGKSAFYLYSRQNGDLERDYHWFVLEPNYLSQGTGHYRSVLQNRRMDGWFWPEVGDANLHIFMDLMQLDGYNPLEVGRATYRVVDDTGFGAWLRGLVKDPAARSRLEAMGRDGFTPGAFLMSLEAAAGADPDQRLQRLKVLLGFSVQREIGALHEGFWVDHWTYILDLLDTYLAVWPDRLEELLVESASYRFFDDPDVILPRSEKFVRIGEEKIRRYGAVVRDQEKEARIAARAEDPWSARAGHGEGAVYHTTLLVKLTVLLVNRAATLDPAGAGVDMEADKPGWNDSMNGLPGILGSALNESLELLRLARFMEEALGHLEESGIKVADVFEELATFMDDLHAALKRRGDAAPVDFWEESNTLKERYREATRLGVSGEARVVPLSTMGEFAGEVRAMLEEVFRGQDSGSLRSPAGVPYTYFVNRVTRWEEQGRTSHQGYPLVTPVTFEPRAVRLFLEGPVHWMKVLPEDASTVYDAVRESPLYDAALGMYKSCEDMTDEDPELGRAVGAYPRGWIENESIYLHMEYKYLLEVLRSGLCDEFFRDARAALIPFQPPERYGRSILEGASFIVSSAFEDEKHHGQAFQPRLSGITCEFIHMWTIMVAGPAPFRVAEDGQLELHLEPRLAPWLFTEEPTSRETFAADGSVISLDVPKDAFAFKFLGTLPIVYHNPSRRPTYGEGAARPRRFCLQYRDGHREEFTGDRLVGPPAEDVRAGRVHIMEVDLA